MTKRTAGTWEAQQGINQMVNDRTTIYFRDGWGVFSDADTHGDAEADCRLIAAAPELLEALKAIIDQGDADAIFRTQTLEAARAAIAKAEGK